MRTAHSVVEPHSLTSTGTRRWTRRRCRRTREQGQGQAEEGRAHPQRLPPSGRVGRRSAPRSQEHGRLRAGSVGADLRAGEVDTTVRPLASTTALAPRAPKGPHDTLLGRSLARVSLRTSRRASRPLRTAQSRPRSASPASRSHRTRCRHSCRCPPRRSNRCPCTRAVRSRRRGSTSTNRVPTRGNSCDCRCSPPCPGSTPARHPSSPHCTPRPHGRGARSRRRGRSRWRPTSTARAAWSHRKRPETGPSRRDVRASRAARLPRPCDSEHDRAHVQ